MKKIIFLLAILTQMLFAQPSLTQSTFSTGDSPFFIENKGQWIDEVLFLTHINGGNVWITDFGIVFDYFRSSRNGELADFIGAPERLRESRKPESISRAGDVIRMEYVNAHRSAPTVSSDVQTAYYNYFSGNDPAKWASFVPLCGEVRIQEIYDGISLRYYFDGSSLRYDYIVQPFSDISQIRLRIEGAKNFLVNEIGELVLQTSLGDVTHGKLFAYQDDSQNSYNIDCGFVINADRTVSIDVQNYDPSKQLVIDPLVFSTYLGGAKVDKIGSIAFDSDENIVVLGETISFDYPTTPGAYDEILLNGYESIFVTKLNNAGSGLIFSTFIGGGFPPYYGETLVVDASDNICFAGHSLDETYPTTEGAYDRTGNGFFDVVATKLNSTGSALLYSTYIGGMGDEMANGMVLDNEGNAYIAGKTLSENFPVTAGAFDQSYDIFGGHLIGEGFLTKLNPQGSDLVFSTYIGGSMLDYASALGLVGSDIVVAGYTESEDFPVIPGAFSIDYHSLDIFVVKFNSTGSGLLFSTYIGDYGGDLVTSLKTDSEGNTFLTGETFSPDFPTTPGAFDRTSVGSAIFVTKLNSTGSGLIYSTFIGDCNYQVIANSICLDNGNAVIGGFTEANTYPTTPDAFDASYNTVSGTYSDAVVTKVNANGTGLIYSSYIGGLRNDWGNSVLVDSNGDIILAGYTISDDFPVTPGAYDETYGGDWGGEHMMDVFITKFGFSSDIDDENEPAPSAYTLMQNYPNPFNPATTVQFELPERSDVQITVYNSLGETIDELWNGVLESGSHSVVFDASSYPSGMYLCRMRANAFAETIKMIYLK